MTKQHLMHRQPTFTPMLENIGEKATYTESYMYNPGLVCTHRFHSSNTGSQSYCSLQYLPSLYVKTQMSLCRCAQNIYQRYQTNNSLKAGKCCRIRTKPDWWQLQNSMGAHKILSKTRVTFLAYLWLLTHKNVSKI